MNYTLKLYKKPNTFNFSKNALPFGFAVFPFTESNVLERQRVFVRVLFTHDMESNALLNEIWSGYVSPDKDGYGMLDLSAIIDAQLDYFVPKTNIIKLFECKKQCGQFKVQYYFGDNFNILSNQHESDTFYVYKGGVAIEEFDNAASFLNDDLVAGRKPLHYYDKNERVRTDEPRWMYFIYTQVDENATVITPFIQYSQTNGVNLDIYAFEQNLILTQYQVYCCPVGFEQLGVGANAVDGDLVYKYTVNLQDQAGPDTFVAATFWVDRRPFYDVKYLHYRNSIGGLETQAVTGEIETGIQTDGDRAEVLPMADWFGNAQIPTQAIDPRNVYNTPVKANTGWVSLLVLLRLRDLMLNRQSFLVYGKRLKPLYINSRSGQLYRSKDKLYSLSFDYSTAYENENVSPENLIEFSEICPAVDFLWASQERGRYIKVFWKLPAGYDKVQISYTVDIFPATTFVLNFDGNTASAEIDIYGSAPIAIVDFEVTLKARVICNDEVQPYSYGAWSGDVILDGASIIEPIANDDVADEGVNSIVPRVLKVNGAELNVLDNDKARNGGALGFEGVFNAAGTVATGTSENGANVQQYGAGGILYLPTAASIAATVDDIIYYKCNEYIPLYGYMLSDVGRIVVPLKGSIGKVYVKLATDDHEVIQHNYGFLGQYQADDSIFDVYLQFFKDPGLTIPLDVTGMGITIGYKIQEIVTHYSYFGNAGTPGSPTSSAVVNVTCSGYSMLLISDWKQREWTSSGPGAGGDETARTVLSDLGGTLGSFEYVGW